MEDRMKGVKRVKRVKRVKGVKGVKEGNRGCDTTRVEREGGGWRPRVGRVRSVGRVVGREGSEVRQGGCMRWEQRPH